MLSLRVALPTALTWAEAKKGTAANRLASASVWGHGSFMQANVPLGGAPWAGGNLTTGLPPYIWGSRAGAYAHDARF